MKRFVLLACYLCYNNMNMHVWNVVQRCSIYEGSENVQSLSSAVTQILKVSKQLIANGEWHCEMASTV